MKSYTTITSGVLFAVMIIALTSSMNARADTASAGSGQAQATHGNCKVSAGHGKVSIDCSKTPSCPPGMTGTTSTEDAEIDIPESTEAATDVAGSGSCFPNGEDESSDSSETD